MALEGDEQVDIIADKPEGGRAAEEEEDGSQDGSQGGEGESNTTCMICMEEWTIGSAHRICCLKCGHLFGRSCIERWIKERGQQNAKCPSCNKPARRTDIRDIWCRTIKAYDSSELAELQRQLENERRVCANEKSRCFHFQQVNNELYAGLEKLKSDIIDRDLRIAKLEKLVEKINRCRSEHLANGNTNDTTVLDFGSVEVEDMVVADQQQPRPQELKGRFYKANQVISYQPGGCKSMAICPTSAEILIAQPLPPGNPRLGNDFGVRKYSLLDTTIHSFIYLHTQPLASVQVKPFGDLILTAGQDKKIHLTSINNSRMIQTYECPNEPLCAAWSVNRDQQFYVVSRNCYLALYDMRNTSECIYQKSERIARTTMVSMTSVAQDQLCGVIANDAKGSQFLELSDSSDYASECIDQEVDHLKGYQLPFSGLMGTVDFHKRTGSALITTRRSNIDQNTHHNLIRFKKIEDIDGTARIDCESLRTFKGGRAPDLLSQSRILRHPTLDDHVLVGACDDAARGIRIWDASDNTIFQNIRTNEFVRDMVLYTPENTNQHILYTLHDKGFGVYRWDIV